MTSEAPLSEIRLSRDRKKEEGEED
jgi:hypothetical protein